MTTGAHLSEPGGDRDPSRPNVGPFEPPQSEPVIPPQSELPAVPPVPEPAAVSFAGAGAVSRCRSRRRFLRCRRGGPRSQGIKKRPPGIWCAGFLSGRG